MANPIKGENGILSIYVSSAYKPVACLTSQSLSTTVSVIESNTKCHPGVTTKSAGLFNYSITADGELIDTTTVGGDTTKRSHDALFALQLAKTTINWKIDTDVTNAASVKYYGSGILSDLSLDQGAGDELSTFSMTIEGSGTIVTTDPLV